GDRGDPVAGTVVAVGGGVARRTAAVGVGGQGGGLRREAALAVVAVGDGLAGDGRGLARRHFLDRQADQLVAGVVAEQQRVAIDGHDLAELAAAVVEAVAGPGRRIAQGRELAGGVVGLLALAGRIAPGPGGAARVPAQGIDRSALAGTDVHAQRSVIRVHHAGAVVVGAGHGAAGGVDGAGQAADVAAEPVAPA